MHPSDWPPDYQPSVPSFSYLDLKAESLVILLLQSQNFPVGDTGIKTVRIKRTVAVSDLRSPRRQESGLEHLEKTLQ